MRLVVGLVVKAESALCVFESSVLPDTSLILRPAQNIQSTRATGGSPV